MHRPDNFISMASRRIVYKNIRRKKKTILIYLFNDFETESLVLFRWAIIWVHRIATLCAVFPSFSYAVIVRNVQRA